MQVLAFLLLISIGYADSILKNEIQGIEFLKFVNENFAKLCNTGSQLSWNFHTNITETNKQLMIVQKLISVKFHKEVGKNITSFPWRSFENPSIKRQFKFIANLGIAALSEDKQKKFANLVADMQENYSKSKICEYTPDPNANKRCNMALNPDINRILKNSKSYVELAHVWKEWREKAGKPVRNKFIELVKLLNEAAKLNGFKDAGDAWRDDYESKEFVFEIQALWDAMKPLYDQLHAYVRRQLIIQYGEEQIKSDGPIPAHLFGNMWAQSWAKIAERMMPYPNKPKVDITDMLIQKRYTSTDIFKDAENFFASLGLDLMPEQFWKKSMIERPKNREVVCHASAWDFCNGKDFRIKQCTEINMEDFVVTHHEMGHIQYYMLYADQPPIFRDGANPGFHEALGDLMSLSVVTPKHLHSIGLLEKYADDEEGDINFLFSLAMDKFTFLPFGFLMDQWRWKVFSGEIHESKLNDEWWKLRLLYQGVVPPVERSEEDFDPGAKYHISANVPYVRYFVAHVLQFQFHEILCKLSGHVGPLHKCDIYKSKAAGKKIRDVFSLGSSIEWKEQLKIMTDGETDNMDPSALLNYFEPLMKWLKKKNKDEKIGWHQKRSPPHEVPNLKKNPNGSSLLKSSFACIVYHLLVSFFFSSF